MTTLARSRIWITGASSGIGEALAYDLARRGARLVLSARKAESLEAVRARCEHPDAHQVVPLDLADPASLAAAATSVLGAGAVDVLVHNGGISQRGLAKDTGIDVDRRIMETNYFGTVALTKAVLPSFLARSAGHFVVVTSVVGRVGTPYRSSYAASKHALHGFFDSLRAEVASSGIKISLVCPGFVATNISRNALTGDGSAQGTMDEATARGITPAKCAAGIARVIATNRSEALIGGREIAAVYAKRFAPRILERILERAKVR
jgi:dehydrogenase/reductase SDR family protein 7B